MCAHCVHYNFEEDFKRMWSVWVCVGGGLPWTPQCGPGGTPPPGSWGRRAELAGGAQGFRPHRPHWALPSAAIQTQTFSFSYLYRGCIVNIHIKNLLLDWSQFQYFQHTVHIERNSFSNQTEWHENTTSCLPIGAWISRSLSVLLILSPECSLQSPRRWSRHSNGVLSWCLWERLQRTRGAAFQEPAAIHWAGRTEKERQLKWTESKKVLMNIKPSLFFMGKH